MNRLWNIHEIFLNKCEDIALEEEEGDPLKHMTVQNYHKGYQIQFAKNMFYYQIYLFSEVFGICVKFTNAEMFSTPHIIAFCIKRTILLFCEKMKVCFVCYIIEPSKWVNDSTCEVIT